jgi:hypothetical protein
MKKIFIGIFVFSILAIGMFLWFFFGFSSKVRTSSDSGVTAFTTSSDALVPVYQAPTSPTITLGTSQGSVVVDNFYKTALGAKEAFVVLAQNDNYEIGYDTDSSGFYLDIKQSPFGINLASAETDFLKLLNINQIDACKLTVVVTTESIASSSLSGKLSPLSFCVSSTFGQ